MQDVLSYQITWRFFSDQSLWWFHPISWSLRSCLVLKASRTAKIYPRRWFSCTSCHLSSSLNSLTTTSVWEPSNPCLLWQVRLREPTKVRMSVTCLFEQWRTLTFPSSCNRIFHFSSLLCKTYSLRLLLWSLTTVSSSYSLRNHSNTKAFSPTTRCLSLKLSNFWKPSMYVLVWCLSDSLAPAKLLATKF